jgi:hypothetical protein
VLTCAEMLMLNSEMANFGKSRCSSIYRRDPGRSDSDKCSWQFCEYRRPAQKQSANSRDHGGEICISGKRRNFRGCEDANPYPTPVKHISGT